MQFKISSLKPVVLLGEALVWNNQKTLIFYNVVRVIEKAEFVYPQTPYVKLGIHFRKEASPSHASTLTHTF